MSKKKVKFVKPPQSVEKESETLKFFNSIAEEDVENTMLLLTEATEDEIFDLVVSNPMHYISIFEHYKGKVKLEYNPFIVSRTLGNLFVKFKYGKKSNFHSIGFIDNNITDTEVLECLTREIKICTQMAKDLSVESRKQFLLNTLTDPTVEVGKTDEDEIKINREKRKEAQDKINEMYDFSSIKPTDSELNRAGYLKIPDNMKIPDFVKFNEKKDEHLCIGLACKCHGDKTYIPPVKNITESLFPPVEERGRDRDIDKANSGAFICEKTVEIIKEPKIFTESSYSYDINGRKILTITTINISKFYID